jgi:hypothetical protein
MAPRCLGWLTGVGAAALWSASSGPAQAPPSHDIWTSSAMKRLPKGTPMKALVLAAMAVAILAACSSANKPQRTPSLAEACKEYADAVSALAPQRAL